MGWTMGKSFVPGLALAVLAAALAAPAARAQDSATQINTIQKDVNVVSVYFTVRDGKRHLVSELDKSQFHVFEDGRELPIKFFAHHTDVVLNVGLLLDTGTSMTWILDSEASASSEFLKRVVRPQDLAFVVSYHNRVDVLQLPTSDTGLLQDQLDDIRTWGTVSGPPQRTITPSPIPGIGGPMGGPVDRPNNAKRQAHLYDAIRVSTQHYLKDEVGRKAVVIVALSGDSQSESTLEDAMEVLLQNDVIAYVLQIYDPPRESSRFDRCDVVHDYQRDDHGEEVLKKLAEATGGRMLEVRGVDKMNEALDEIADELHQQYSLGYYPASSDWDGKFRKIQITTQDRSYKVFARKGYYAYPRGK